MASEKAELEEEVEDLTMEEEESIQTGAVSIHCQSSSNDEILASRLPRSIYKKNKDSFWRFYFLDQGVDCRVTLHFCFFSLKDVDGGSRAPPSMTGHNAVIRREVLSFQSFV